MSAKPENTFISSVHRHLPQTVYTLKNHNQYNGGIADVWYSGQGGDLWVEYKFIEIPKRPDTVIDLIGGKSPAISPLQQDWLKKRDAEGRDVGVIVGCKEGGVWFSGVTWDFTYTAEKFRSWLQDRKMLAGYINSLVG
jgi:hypothetical protein